jgi:lysophospholipase L1-like esterase
MRKSLIILITALMTTALPGQTMMKIVILGSSTAEGVGPSHPDSAWVARYRAYFSQMSSPVEVINLAKGGYTTYHIMPTGNVPPQGRSYPDTLRNINRAIGAKDADAVIINLPSNDAANNYSVEDQLANYDAILAYAADAAVPVWITTTQPRNLSQSGRDNIRAMRDSTFSRFGPKAIDFWNGLANGNGTIRDKFDSGDGIHLNNWAHGILSERVIEARVYETITSNESKGFLLPDGIEIERNYPNPFNAATTILYSLPRAETVTLQIYATDGRLVREMYLGRQDAGQQLARLELSNLASGSYFYRLQGREDQSASARLLLLK